MSLDAVPKKYGDPSHQQVVPSASGRRVGSLSAS